MDLLTKSGAAFSQDMTRRVALWRIWDERKKALIMVMMNPSVANETDNDPTVERCQRRAHMLGYGGVRVYNIMDVIETDSRALDRLDPTQLCSDFNRDMLLEALKFAALGEGDVLCAWGKPGQKYGPAAWFCGRAERSGVPLFCLSVNADGSPKHPLYVGYGQEMMWFGGAEL